MQSGTSGDPLVLGRALIKTGQYEEAVSHFIRVLAEDPGNQEALEFIVDHAIARDESDSTIVLIERALAAGAQGPGLYRLLGLAHLASGNAISGRAALERSLAQDPRQFKVWLKMGRLNEDAGLEHAALICYFRAMTSAQEQGRWLNDETTGPAMRAPVKHAMEFIDAGRARLFKAAIEPLRQQYGQAALARIDRCLAAYLGEEALVAGHPLQKSTFLHVPGLPVASFHARELFPWMDELEANADAIREEALAILAEEGVLEPFFGEGSDGEASGQLRNDFGKGQGKPAWDAFFFYRHGMRYDDNCARCPKTAELIDRLPLVRIDGHAPEIMFSVLTPGSHIMPHTGVTNARLVAHLPLIVPPDCAIRVGDEQRAWQEGQGFVFDDTLEHEAWNRSRQTRVVLIMDAWNPYLTEVERQTFTDIVHAIAEFHRACGFVSEAEKIARGREQKAQAKSA